MHKKHTSTKRLRCVNNFKANLLETRSESISSCAVYFYRFFKVEFVSARDTRTRNISQYPVLLIISLTIVRVLHKSGIWT